MPTLTPRRMEPNEEFQSLKVVKTRSRKPKGVLNDANKETRDNQRNTEEDVDSMYLNFKTPVNLSKRKNIDDESQSESPILNKRLRRMVDPCENTVEKTKDKSETISVETMETGNNNSISENTTTPNENRGEYIEMYSFEEDLPNNDTPFEPDNRNLDESMDSLCAE